MGMENFSAPESTQEKKLEGKEREDFLNKIYADGRAEFYSWFTKDPVSGYRGWNPIGDDQTSQRFNLVQGNLLENKEQLEKEGYDAQVQMTPLTRRVPVSEEKERVIKGGWFKKDTVEKYKEIVNYKTEPRLLKDFGKDSEDQAFMVSYHKILHEPSGHFSFDGRPGKTFDAFFVVPKAEAEEIKKAVQADPTIIKELIAKFNPKLMEFMEKHGGLPDPKAIFFVPKE